MHFSQCRIVQCKVEVVLLEYIAGGALNRAIANIIEAMGAVTRSDNLKDVSHGMCESMDI